MNTENGSNTQADLSRVLEKITEIATASATGDYIYRGEQGCYKKVSSNLYREYEADIEAEQFDIEVVQKEILREAREYTHKTDDLEILTELQHHDGKTNLIDFTTDYLVALFFACDGNRYEPGRVILLKNQSEAYEVVKPPRTIERAGVQKSIFVQSPSGLVEPDTVVCIPADLKGDMLDYLRKHHDISTKTIYNDLLGFIKNRSGHKSAYTEFYTGLTCQERGDSAKVLKEKQEWYDKAVEHYTTAINLNPERAEVYTNRGIAYAKKDEFDTAIQDYNTAINLNPELTEAYNNRGNAYRGKGDLEMAIQDHTKAIDLNPKYADAYYNRGFDYWQKGEVDLAIQDYTKTIDLNPEDTDAYYNRGIAYAKKDEFDTAIQDYNTAIHLNPEHANAYTNRGIAYHKNSEFDTAIQDYNTAINLNPEHANTYNNRGIVYAGKGEFDKAIQDYTKAIELNPEEATVYYNRGEAWLHLGEWRKAKTDLSTAKNMGFDIFLSFYIDHRTVSDFEAKCGVEVPEDLAALLR